MGSNLLIECTLFLHFIPISLVIFIPWMVWNLAFLQFNCCKIFQISWQEVLFTINILFKVSFRLLKNDRHIFKAKNGVIINSPHVMKKANFWAFLEKIKYFFIKNYYFLPFFMIFVFFLHFWIKHNWMVNKLYCIQSIG